MDYQGNTQKDKDKRVAENIAEHLREEQKLEKVVTGEVLQKKKGVGTKFKTIFFGGDAKQATLFVVSDVVLPGLRNLLFDMGTEGLKKLLFGDAAPRGRQGTRGPVIDYRSRFQTTIRPYDTRYESQSPINAYSRVRQNRHEINDVIVGTREEAETVIERLITVLDQYDVVSLAALYELLGLETSYIDNKWGWTNLASAQVRQIRQGYLLELPPLEEI